ncbi:MAG: hypothetical protein HRT36_02095 [Alphaproteobacteria bacterium]|nr:hypothetical protein [Alphaproteobacteria bacterium]
MEKQSLPCAEFLLRCFGLKAVQFVAWNMILAVSQDKVLRYIFERLGIDIIRNVPMAELAIEPCIIIEQEVLIFLKLASR